MYTCACNVFLCKFVFDQFCTIVFNIPLVSLLLPRYKWKKKLKNSV